MLWYLVDALLCFVLATRHKTWLFRRNAQEDSSQIISIRAYYTEMISANLVPDDRDLQNIGLFLVSQTSVKTSATF